MCRGSAARALYEAETRPCICTSATTFFLLGGGGGGGWAGGFVRLTAKPRYLLLLHRGKKKSNTVTALAGATQSTDAAARSAREVVISSTLIPVEINMTKHTKESCTLFTLQGSNMIDRIEQERLLQIFHCTRVL